MRWSGEAEQAVSKVPFFVRKRVRKRVEEEARAAGASEVSMEHVRASQRRFLDRMEEEVKGYQVETCFGPGGCPNRAVAFDPLAEILEERLRRRDLRAFLQQRVQGPLKLHHEFRISVSDCPNGCSRPQIADLGMIGARKPVASDEPCSRCGECVRVCREEAIAFPQDAPLVDERRCVSCGQCLAVCPTGALRETKRGFRILVGGKLGRHPRLGTELPWIYPLEEALQVVERCLDQYQEHCREGERFGEILERTGGAGLPLTDEDRGEG
jgi:anaerobic sulfite reductase subunit C